MSANTAAEVEMYRSCLAGDWMKMSPLQVVINRPRLRVGRDQCSLLPQLPGTTCSGREEIDAIETKYLKDVLMEETGIFLNQFLEQTIKNQERYF